MNTKEERRAAAVEAILDYLRDNEDEFNDVIEDLDSYNGYLSDDRYHRMEDLDELYSGTNPSEILARAFYGYDEDTYNTDAHGSREYGPFNPNREYFRFNGYGNLVSADWKDYSAHLDKWFVDALQEDRPNLWNLSAELDELLNALDAADEDEEGDAE